jgi:CheY-like chemotaxis protein
MADDSMIFVVDDDLEDREILSEYFHEIGMFDRVRFFSNSEKALVELNATRESSNLPRLIVLDLNMPILNGTQALLMIKREARLKHIPVIILSTSDNDEERRKCLSYGAVDYLVKPMSFDEGRDIVERFVSYL